MRIRTKAKPTYLSVVVAPQPMVVNGVKLRKGDKIMLRSHTQPKPVKVVGLDISLKAPGVCVAWGNPNSRVGELLEVETATIAVGATLRGPERLSYVTRAVWGWIASRGATEPGTTFVTEGYAFSAQQAHSLGEIGGCIRKVIWEAGGNLVIVPPPTLKKFMTGKGVGDKNLVLKHAFKRWGFDGEDDNQCDAFGAAMIGLLEADPNLPRSAQDKIMLAEKVIRHAGKDQKSSAGAKLATVKRQRQRPDSATD